MIDLPPSLIQKASLRGGEYGWRIADVPGVLAEAVRLGLACIGGQFQFRFPGATCEMYWLNADATARKATESWEDYVRRSVEEVKTTFERLCRETDFRKEAERWTSLRERNVDPLEYLWFVAYFECE